MLANNFALTDSYWLTTDRSTSATSCHTGSSSLTLTLLSRLISTRDIEGLVVVVVVVVVVVGFIQLFFDAHNLGTCCLQRSDI
jgi:hypothetical protein